MFKTTVPRHKIAYRFATTPDATGVCGECGRWTFEAHFSGPCPACGNGWVMRSDLNQGEISAAAACASAADSREDAARIIDERVDWIEQ